MARLYKVEMYILDANDYYSNLDEIVDRAEWCGAKEANFIPFNSEVVELEWDDDIDINQGNTTVDTYRNYFSN